MNRSAGAALAGLLLAACSQPVPSTAPSQGTPVATAAGAPPTEAAACPESTHAGDGFGEIEFTADDGEVREGRVYGSGSDAVVLTHMGRSGDSQEDWAPFATELADAGYGVLTYNSLTLEGGWEDVLGAVASLRACGAETVIVGGASIGAMASLRAAQERGSDVNGVIWLAGVLDGNGYGFEEAGVAAVDCEILIASGDEDAFGAAEDAAILDDWAAPQSELLIVPSTLHGTDILLEGGAEADALREAMLAYVDGVAADPGSC